MIQFNAFYGLDVHQNTISIARVLPEEEAKYIKTIENTEETIREFFLEELKTFPICQAAYEAGGCGFTFHRLLVELGIHNQVIAPTLIPKLSGKRVKNDKIDSIVLANFLKNGQLTQIYIPTEEDEVVREKTRQREAIKKAAKVAKQQVLGFLRRYGLRYTLGKTNWTKTYWAWLRQIQFDNKELHFIFLDYVQNIETLEEIISKMDVEIGSIKDCWSKKEIVDAVSALKGFDTLNATSVVSEIGNFSRFNSAGEFMDFIGLTPSEYSSGKKVTRGSITKMGNSRVRRLLTEATKGYRKMPRKSRVLLGRWQGLPKEIQEHAWKAQRRLFKQYWKYMEKGKHPNVATTAVARELAGFIWAIGIMAENIAENKALDKAA